MANQSIKYLAYLRKSSEQEDRQALSIPSQKEELEPVAGREKLNVVGWLDESHSAKKKGRPVFNDMIQRIESGEINSILTWNINRLSRNAVDTGTLIDLFDRGRLLEIRAMNQVFRNNPNDKFLLTLLCGQAKLENDNKGVDVKRGLARKARMGWRPSGAATGYLNTPTREKGCKIIYNDPERFSLVKRMWDLMLTGNYTAPKIWKLSKEWGLTTVKHKKIGGKPLSRSAVYAVFTNPFYYGWYQYRDDQSGELIWQKGEHEPMITETEYDRVQVILGRKGRPRPQKHTPAFTGIMRCPCGSSITADPPRTKRQKNGNVHTYVYYHCTKRKDPNCIERSIELKELNQQILEKLQTVNISEKFKSWAIKYLHEVRVAQAQSQESIFCNKQKELSATINQLDGLLLKYTSPDNASGALISSEEYQALKGRLLKQKASLEADLGLQGKEIESWVELSEKTFNFACYANIWFEKGDDQAKRAILACLGSNFVLKDRKLNVNLHPFFHSIILSKQKVEAELANVRTSENVDIKRQNGHFVPACPSLLPSPKLIITLEDKNYMLGLKEKMAEILRFYKNIGVGVGLQNQII